MQNDDSAARLKTFAQILKFGHDLFEAGELYAASAVAVNDSRALLNFRSAVLFEMVSDRKVQLLGQFAQRELHPHSAAVQCQKQLIESLKFDSDNTCVLSADELPDTLAVNDAVYFCCKLNSPTDETLSFIWLLEYEKEIPPYVQNLAKLMGKSVAEALTLAKLSRNGSWKTPKKIKKAVLFILFSILFAVAMFIPVPETETAEFSLKSQNITAAYARFDGHLAQCLKQDGDMVKKGEAIIRYDIAQRQYQYESAAAALREAQENFQLEMQNAFTDEEKLGKAKLLKARCAILQVAVKEAEWFLKHSEITSPADGVLALADGRAELVAGKAVRSGDKLFEIFDTNGMIAEIMVNERSSSVLQKKFTVGLFLHTAPEKMIPAEIIEISAYPELTEQKSYCYPIRVKIPAENAKQLRFGMRGVAKLSGAPIPLGYFLFKSLILYFRNW